MNKKVFAIGILLIIIGIALGGTIAPQESGIKYSSMNVRLQANADSLQFYRMYLNASGSLEIAYNASGNLGFVVANATAFGILTNSTPNTLIGNAEKLENAGVLEIANASRESFPYLSANSTKARNSSTSSNSIQLKTPIYTNAAAGLLSAGYYYAIFANNASSNVDIKLGYVTLPVSGVQNEYSSLEANGIAASAFVFLGLVLILVSVMIKGGKPKQAEVAIDHEAEELYEKIEREDRNKRKRVHVREGKRKHSAKNKKRNKR